MKSASFMCNFFPVCNSYLKLGTDARSGTLRRGGEELSVLGKLGAVLRNLRGGLASRLYYTIFSYMTDVNAT